MQIAQRGSKSVPEYLLSIRVLADEVVAIDSPLSDDDLTLYVMNGLGLDYHDIAAPIRAHEKPLSFEELHVLLVAHDTYLKRLESTTTTFVVTANASNRRNNPHQKYQHRNQNRGSTSTNKRNSQSRSSRNDQQWPSVVCQWCDRIGHIAKTCRQKRSR